MLCSLASLVQCCIEDIFTNHCSCNFVAKYNVLVIIECTVLLEILKCLKGSVFSLTDNLRKTEQLMPCYVTLFLTSIEFLCVYVCPHMCVGMCLWNTVVSMIILLIILDSIGV